MQNDKTFSQIRPTFLQRLIKKVIAKNYQSYFAFFAGKNVKIKPFPSPLSQKNVQRRK
jgi:hypothetical protein